MTAPRIAFPPEVALTVATRDNYTCHVCGTGYDPADPWEVDHDIPLARGGTNSLRNLRLAHRSCNRDKAAT